MIRKGIRSEGRKNEVIWRFVLYGQPKLLAYYCMDINVKASPGIISPRWLAHGPRKANQRKRLLIGTSICTSIVRVKGLVTSKTKEKENSNWVLQATAPWKAHEKREKRVIVWTISSSYQHATPKISCDTATQTVGWLGRGSTSGLMHWLHISRFRRRSAAYSTS